MRGAVVIAKERGLLGKGGTPAKMMKGMSKCPLFRPRQKEIEGVAQIRQSNK